MANWRKLGRLFDPAEGVHHPKLQSHAANPLPVLLGGDVYRIFYNGRDAKNRSSIGAVDIDIAAHKIIHRHGMPVFTFGPKGSFYADGVSIGNLYTVNDKSYMLFLGWLVPLEGRWQNQIGRLVFDSDMNFELSPTVPLLAIQDTDSSTLSYPYAMTDQAGGYVMWYGTTVTWNAGNGEMLHTINVARSENGHEWRRCGQAVPYQLSVAQVFSRPVVAKHREQGLEMWFSYRGEAGQAFRIGYARSIDGCNWALELENVGIDVSEQGWDEEMIAYPFVFDHKGDRFMLYCGNGYGRTGFGLAVFERG
jgi:hypothetical protein